MWRLILVILLCSVAFAQDVTVTVPLRAVRKNAEVIKDLRPSDLVVTLKNQPVKDFSLKLANEEPLDLSLVLDNSGSTRREPLRQDLLELLQARLPELVRKGTDRFAVVNFNEQIFADALPTDDPQSLALAVKRAKSQGGSAVYAALVKTSTSLFLRHSERRVILLVSDGLDNASRVSAQDAIQAALARRVVVAVFYVPDGSEHRWHDGSRFLQELAAKSGGRLWQPATRQELERSWSEFVAWLQAQHSVHFTVPLEQRSKRVRLKIKSTISKVDLQYPDTLTFEDHSR